MFFSKLEFGDIIKTVPDLKGHIEKTITQKCFDLKFVSNRLFHVSNRLIRAKSARKRKKNLDLPQKQCVSKAKLGRICVILSPCQSRPPQGKLLQRERIHTRKHSTHLRAAIFISLSRLVSTIKK